MQYHRINNYSISAQFEAAGLAIPTLEQVNNRDWISVIDSQQPSERSIAYACLSDTLTIQEMADLFSYVWVHSEGSLTHQQIDFLFRDFANRGITREMIMSTEERAEFAALPDPFIIYRGCQDSTRVERSWTLSRNIAIMFAHRAADENSETQIGIVIQASCPKSAVLAYLNRSHAEQEVIVKPQEVVIDADPVETVTNEQ
jgi:hypothetical protein